MKTVIVSNFLMRVVLLTENRFEENAEDSIIMTSYTTWIYKLGCVFYNNVILDGVGMGG